MLFLAPVLIALPPRKMDLYTFSLAAAFVVSANHYTKERTGKGIWGHLPSAGHLPQRAREIQAQQQTQQRERVALPAQRPGGLEAKAKELWMGGETEGWKERRLREEQEKIARGEGYGSMITNQIWEVWNWGQTKREELKEEDERILRERERNREFPGIGKEGK
jgi:hypothetical protein